MLNALDTDAGCRDAGQRIEQHAAKRIAQSLAKATLQRIDDKLSIHQVLNDLPPNDRQLIILRFYKGLTQSKTADIMGISQVQVSRKEKIILNNMRRKLG